MSTSSGRKAKPPPATALLPGDHRRKRSPRDRYQKPARSPQSFADLFFSYYRAKAPEQRIARLGAVLAEAQRVEAVNELLTFARVELAKAGDPSRCFSVTALQEERQFLWEFLTAAGLQILTADDPVAELNRFLGHKRGRPPVDNTYRDHTIAGDVQKRVDGGSSVEDACKAVASVVGLGQVAVRKIYYSLREQINARWRVLLRKHDPGWKDAFDAAVEEEIPGWTRQG